MESQHTDDTVVVNYMQEKDGMLPGRPMRDGQL